MKRLATLVLVISACADVAPPVDAIDDTFVASAKADGVGIEEGSPEACIVLAAANSLSEGQLDGAADLDARAAHGIATRRPFATLAALDAVPYVGPIAFERLLTYAEDAGFTCGGAANPAGACTATGGTYDGVAFTVAAECKAVAFLNGARMSDMRALTDIGRKVAYEHCAQGATCTGYRFTGWASVREFADWPRVGSGTVKGLAKAAAAWTASDAPAWDTIADAWARRGDLVGASMVFEKVYVSRGGIEEHGSYDYACVEVRDAPDARNYLHACMQFINADSATQCSNDPARCLAPWVGQWVWMRGTLRTSNAHPGGYKINLLPDGVHAANPALTSPVEPPAPTGGLDEAWRAAAIADADRLVTDGPLPAPSPAASMPAAVQARVDVFSSTAEVSVIETYQLTVQGHPVYLVLATDGSGEGNLVWADLIDETGAWFAHGIAHTLWDGGSGLSWSLDEEDTTLCRCSAPGAKALCTWLDGSTHESSSITCE
jgi:hypothetical protein